MHVNYKKVWCVVAAGALATPLLAACGSSSKTSAPTTASTGGEGGTGASGSGSPATGTPIKIMYSGTIHSSTFDLVELEQAVQAYTKYTNANGGINGHPVTLDICDAAENANQGAQCARQAVSNGDVAVLNGFTAMGSGVYEPILQPAGIPYVNPSLLSPVEFSSPVAFPVVAGVIAEYVGLGQVFSQNGCKNAGVIEFSGSQEEVVKQEFAAGLKQNGGTVVKTVQVGQGLPDYTAPVQAIQSSNAQCLALIITTPEMPKALLAIQQAGLTIPKGGPIDIFPHSVTAGPGGNGTVIIGSNYLATDPQAATAVGIIKKYSPGSQPTGQALQAYAGAVMLYGAMKQVTGAVSASSVLQALSNLNNFDTGLTAPITTTTPGPTNFTRLFNTQVLNWKVVNGTPQLQGSFTKVSLG